MWRWDIFCRVVDNYGDIGTCWRLARQLANEYEADVRLWVDQLQSFSQLCPAVSVNVDEQRVDEIEICRWQPDFPTVEAADVVIEAFACDLPESYVEAMNRRETAPAWVNLEYLSAETWVEGCHRLPSPQMKWPSAKYFFFPGFTPLTGGLLRERDLRGNRMAFDSAAEADWWQSIGIPPRNNRDVLRVSIFCYQNASLSDLLRCWAEGPDEVIAMVMPGPAAEQTAKWFGASFLPGTPLRRSSLTAYALPFLPQSSFDRLLWACDVNFVRGEDSFVRAQWAERPFVWQVYPQTEGAHVVKLEAFLTRYLDRFPSPDVVRQCWRAWNGQSNIAAAWADFVACRKVLEEHGKSWARTLDQTGDLADNLVRFVRGIC